MLGQTSVGAPRWINMADGAVCGDLKVLIVKQLLCVAYAGAD